MATGKAMQKAEEVIKGAGIPPQPEVILKIRQEMGLPNPNISKIALLVMQDVGLTATVLKIASSPMIGFGKVDTIDRALNLMGVKNFYNLVVSAALRDVLAIKGLDQKVFEAFWRHSLQTARACTFVMERVDKSYIDDAYLAGLFHDCAIPMMLKQFKDYSKVADFAMGPTPAATKAEESLFNTNHTIVGYLMAKSWKLPKEIADAITWHHSLELKFLKDEKARCYVSTIRLAENLIIEQVMTFYKKGLPEHQQDTMASLQYLSGFSLERLMHELDLSNDDIEDIREDIQDIIGE
jgi:HD-like signal output (HDOD) protein